MYPDRTNDDRTENEMNHRHRRHGYTIRSTTFMGMLRRLSRGFAVLIAAADVCCHLLAGASSESSQSERCAECGERQRRAPDIPRRRRPASTMYTRLYRNSHLYLARSTIQLFGPHHAEIARPPSY